MRDLEVAYNTMAIPDPRDPRSAAFPPPGTWTGPKAHYLGVYKEWVERADPVVKDLYDSALEGYKALGYELVDISIPLLPSGQLAHAMTILAEISAFVGPTHDLTAANKILVSVGQRSRVADFLAAQKMRSLLMAHLAALFVQYPGLVVVTPVTPNCGWKHSEADLVYGVSDANKSVRSMEYVFLANFTGCPALSLPVGYSEDTGIPVALMGMGEWGSEDALLAWGKDGEKWFGEKRMRSGIWVDVLGGENGEATKTV
jgi:Asp-tRNA(Asn)/Glu-tRNA(Gln) amidotransferase A subunit family amidase